MSNLIHKNHNVSALLYHLLCPTKHQNAKYRRAVITDEVEAALQRVCFDISNRYEITFLDIGTDQDHIHPRSHPLLGSIRGSVQPEEDRPGDQEHHGA